MPTNNAPNDPRSSPNWMKRVETLKRRYGLTTAEAEVALMVEDGLSNSEISWLRDISVNTVKTLHTMFLYKKVRMESGPSQSAVGC